MKQPTIEEQNAAIEEVLKDLTEFLKGKNLSYGGSAFTPLAYGDKQYLEEAIDVRMVDKIRRLTSGKEYAGDDTEKDLTGYLIIKRAVKLLKEKGFYLTD